jgi:isoquinoline 1-oxidoreductase beta subunit
LAASTCHTSALQLAVDKSGYGSARWRWARLGVAVHESFNTVVAYVVEASTVIGTPVLHQVTAGCIATSPHQPDQHRGADPGRRAHGLSRFAGGAAITLKDKEQSNLGTTLCGTHRITDMPAMAV